MLSEKLEDLRSLVRDESLPVAERRIAAEHYITTLVDSVPPATDDDPEVVRLQKPWPQETETDRLMYEMCSKFEECKVNGWSLSDAKKEVTARHKERAVMAAIVDEAAHRLERLAGCQFFLNKLNDVEPRNFYRVNGYSPERMLAAVKPSSHPPQSWSDVW